MFNFEHKLSENSQGLDTPAMATVGPHVFPVLSRRHMLLFTAYSSVGHSIHVCSMVTFVIGDEDVVLPYFEPVNILATVTFGI